MEMFNIYLPVAGIQFNALLLLLIGFCVGVLGGFFGVGGAWIVTPALNIFGFPMPYAIGTDFAHIFGKSIIATRKHGRMGNVDWKLGLITMIGTIPGVESGAQLIMYLERLGKASGTDLVGTAVRWSYILMLIGLGCFMLYDYFVLRVNKAEKAKIPGQPESQKKSLIRTLRNIKIPPMITLKKSGIESISLWVIVVIFYLCGFISGFLGVGGGFIRMPTLVYLIGCPTALAVGTDLFVVMLDGGYGCLTYALKGRVELLAAAVMLCGAAIGAQIGVTAVKYIRGYGIRLLFAFMIMFAGCSVLLKQLQSMTKINIFSDISGIVILSSAGVICLIIMIRMFQSIFREKRVGLESNISN